ncbi:hypothetical protein SBA4_4430011 [Candidatus Sulfopaludibacter sp. SbA4]|nr:hypothetical protein SBA4_4430011 [Candidatus Sulfopaludibacter sp. SbA4]
MVVYTPRLITNWLNDLRVQNPLYTNTRLDWEACPIAGADPAVSVSPALEREPRGGGGGGYPAQYWSSR